jgi:Cu+-exporting ATPase
MVFAGACEKKNLSQGGIMTTDPVCGMKVDEKRSEFQTQFAGKKYSFCSENCKREFEADPDEFVETAAA